MIEATDILKNIPKHTYVNVAPAITQGILSPSSTTRWEYEDTFKCELTRMDVRSFMSRENEGNEKNEGWMRPAASFYPQAPEKKKEREKKWVGHGW